MPTSVTPSSLLLHQIDQFHRLLPGVRDGGVEAIHDARVATRRMRELVPLVTAYFTEQELRDVERVVRKATRALGRARDVDVMLALLGSLERAVPNAAAEAAEVRVRWSTERDRLVRRAIKTLEKLEVANVLNGVRQTLESPAHRLALTRRGVSWQAALGRQLPERAGALQQAIEHAAGVLFPNRLHAARIAMKKLRYSMEIATATAARDFTEPLRPLKKAQELLGRIHDFDVLAGVLAEEHATGLLALVNHEQRRLHARYRRRRDALAEAGSRAAAAVRSHPRMTPGRLAMATLPLALLVVPLVRRRTA